MVLSIYCTIVGYYTASSDNSLPTFRDNLLILSSSVNENKRLSLNVQQGIITTHSVITQNRPVCIYFMSEAWNHANWIVKYKSQMIKS